MDQKKEQEEKAQVVAEKEVKEKAQVEAEKAAMRASVVAVSTLTDLIFWSF